MFSTIDIERKSPTPKGYHPGFVSFEMAMPSGDPKLCKQVRQVNAWAGNMRKLFTGEQPIEKLSLEEASLICALGLPGAEDLNINESLNTFRNWVQLVRINTEHWMPLYHDSPEQFGSLAQFQCQAMMTILQKHLGISYNLSFSQGDYDPRDSCNLFIHGLLSGQGGACVSMPTLFCTIGRRLGYPLFLAYAKQHIFVRWHDQQTGERFNFDGTSKGFLARDDNYYRHHVIPLTHDDITRFPRYLQSLTTRREELGLMLGERAQCLMFNLRPVESLCAHSYANLADSDNRLLSDNWAIDTALYKAFETSATEARKRNDPHYPLDHVKLPAPGEAWERSAHEPASRKLEHIKKLYPKKHLIRIA